MNSKDLTRNALFLTIIITQQYLLSGIPNISATFVLILIVIRLNGGLFYKNLMFLITYVLILNIIYGFTVFTIIQFLSYLIILVYNIYNIKRVILVSILTMWVYIPFSVLIYDIDLVTYFIADLPFTIIYVVNNVLGFIWLYPILESRLVND